jgi:hypothetical protein
MDLFAGLFSVTLLFVSLLVAYHFGIKPEREEKKRRAEQALAEMRCKRSEALRRKRHA